MTDAVRFEAGSMGGAGAPPARDLGGRPSSLGASGRGAPDRGVFVLDSDAWAALSRMLELPVRDVVGLRELLSGATILP